MALDSTVLETRVASGSPYQLNKVQVLRASNALLKHIRTEAQKKEASSITKNLLVADPVSPDIGPAHAEPVWLILTSKKFMTDKHNLKPRKIQLPHSLNTSTNTSICLITPEPQRQFKDAIGHPSFPAYLSSRITRIISLKKLEVKFKSFEQKRQLRDSHDIFLADDRIISYLTPVLGKTFYKSTSKRPIPIDLQPPKPKEKQSPALPSTKKVRNPSVPTTLLSPTQIAQQVNRTLSTTQLHLSPSSNTAIRVGLGSFSPEQLAENIEAVMAGVAEKLVAWRNVRGLHVKGSNTIALPLWLAEELWTDEGMVLEKEEVREVKKTAKQKAKGKGDSIKGPVAHVEELFVQATKRKEVLEEDHGAILRHKKVKRVAEEVMSAGIKERS